MDKQRAKFILQSYRPEADGAPDLQFHEALQIAREDPQMAAWFAEEQARDAAIRRKLMQVRPPPELSQQLLTDLRSVSVAAPASRRSLWSLAAAAGLVLLAGLAWWWQLRPPSAATGFANYQREMIRSVKGGVNFDFASADPAKLQRWLASNPSLAGFVLPAGLREKPGLGCRSLRWQGQPVGLICFEVGPNHEVVHLFVAPRSAVAELASSASSLLHVDQSGEWSSAHWTDNGFAYLAVTQSSDPHYLEKFL